MDCLEKLPVTELCTLDLHTHSSYSDGTDRPLEIVRKAKELGLEKIALTDHDVIDGWEEFLDADIGIKTIPGVELSIDDLDGIKGIHLLGYFNPDHPNFAQTKEELLEYGSNCKDARRQRLDKIIFLLKQEGLVINRDDVLQEAKGEVVARPHIANVIYRTYSESFQNLRQVYVEYLGNEGKAYVSIEDRLGLGPGIVLIKKLGGTAILAHPGVSNGKDKDVSKGKRLLIEALALGADGAEGFYLYHKNDPYRGTDFATSSLSANLSVIFSSILLSFGKIVSAGSDYHGGNKNIALGEHREVIKDYFGQDGGKRK